MRVSEICVNQIRVNQGLGYLKLFDCSLICGTSDLEVLGQQTFQHQILIDREFQNLQFTIYLMQLLHHK